jgi:hypothetical protein
VITAQPIQDDRFAACGCCGEIGLVGVADPLPIIEVEDGVFRCEKHVGRLPCCIEGCGRTFAMKDDDTYHHRMMCGLHWRSGPKHLRDRVAKLRRLAKRRGWSDRLLWLHGRAWEANRKAIVEGRSFDLAEVNKLFGWSE